MKLSEVMKRSTFIRGNSKVIFSINYSDVATSGDVADINRYVGTVIEKMPKKSMLLLLDVRKLCVNGDTNEHLKEMFELYSSYFKASAVVVDENNENEIKDLIKTLGFTKMIIYTNPELARKSLFGGDNPGRYIAQ